MNIKQSVTGLLLRGLRIAGLLLVIYVSMVFYLALTERRNAYPRAITHTEAEAAIQNTANPITCTLADGTVLSGWSIGNTQDPVLLYYPDADEDAAQFLAEVQQIQGLTLVSFNLRGSASNKGTPSADTFEPDAKEIAECASQVNGQKPVALAGRGTGAILAAEQLGDGQKVVLIDPVLSIADAISDKYRFLYPKFLVRAKEKLPIERLKKRISQVFLLFDRQTHCDRNHKVVSEIPLICVKYRQQSTLSEALKNIFFE